jgi:sulfatase maturation enzyme AslB (radical SAM superfamily)
LKKALDYCKENKINAKIPARYGIPICFLEEYADYFDNSWERYRWEGNCDKVKMPECNECRFYDLCDGLWDEYVKMFGFSEMIVDKHREIRINMDCNMDCLFCNTDNHSENVFLDLKKSVQELIRWHEQGVDYLTISGKEPTLSKDLIPLIKTAKKCGFKKIELQTNAVLCNDDFVEKLKIAGLTSAFISFHSANKDSYEKITQSKETFEKIVNGINCFLNKGIEVTLNIVINELNYKDVPITVKYIHNSFRGINSIVFSFVAPVCNALNNKWIIPKISLVVPYLKKALDYCKENKINAKIPARCGIPIHFLREYADYFDNFRERNRWINSKDKIKTPECNKCEFYDFCDGFWEEYVKIHGFK